MLYYLGFYILTSFLFVLSSIFRSKVFIWLVVFIAFTFSAFRYDAGYDFFSYLDLIQYEDGARFQRLEPLNKIIISYSRNIDFPQFYYIVTSFIYILFMTLGFRYTENFNIITVSSMLFFMGAYLTSFDIIRQMIAVSIVFYTILLFLNKKIFVVLLLFFLAIGFHKSAYLFLGIVFYIKLIGHKRFNFYTYFIVILISLFSTELLVFISNYTGLYSNYFSSGGNNTGEKIYLMILFYIISLFFLSRLCKVERDDFWMYFNLFFLGILIYTALLPYGYFATRISYFLFPFGFLAWSELIKESSRNKMIISMYVYMFSSIVFFLILLFSNTPDRDYFLNYSFYFLN